MNTDTIVYNTLERALSTDLNDSESMISRALCDAVGSIGGRKFQGPALPTAVARNWTVGLDLVTDGANGAVLLYGALMQASTTWPAAVGPLDSAFRLGFNRAPSGLPVVLPVDAAPHFWLLEMRVKDVTTVSQVRDVFNPSTQTFSPALVPKQRERQVELQWVGPVAGKWPTPSGGSWIPAYVYLTPGGGAPAPLDVTRLVDVRTYALDGQDDASLGAAAGDGRWMDSQFATLNSPGVLAHGYQILGNLRGKVSGQVLQMLGLPGATGVLPVAESGYAYPVSTLVHFYLCPIYLGGKPHGARTVGFPDPLALLQGEIVMSLVSPRTLVKTNSAAITLPAFPFGNWDGGVIPADGALYVGSAASNAGGGGFDWMTQDSNGFALVDSSNAVFLGAAGYVGAITLLGITVGMDLRSKIPKGARSVLVQVLAQGTAGTTAVGISFVDAGSDLLATMDLRCDTPATQRVEIPCGGWTESDFYHNIALQIFPNVAGNLNLRVDVVGWRQ